MTIISRPSIVHLNRTLGSMAHDPVPLAAGDAHRAAWCRIGLLLADATASVLSLGGALALSTHLGAEPAGIAGPDAAVQPGVSLVLLATLLGGTMAYFAIRTHYGRRVPFWSEIRQILLGSLVALLCNAFVEFSFGHGDTRGLLICAWVLFPLLTLALRTVARRILSQLGMWHIPVVIVGDGEAARQAARALQSEPRLGYDVTATIPLRDIEDGLGGQPWRRVMQQSSAGLLVLAPGEHGAPGRRTIEGLVRERVPFAMMPQLEGLPVLGFDSTRFFSHDTVMFRYRNNLAQPVARFAKVAFDLSVTALGILAIAPVLLVVAALVKLDGGPVFFAHPRVGAGGRIFKCLKFRSMVMNSDAVLRQTLAADPAAREEWADTHKLRNDPRVTWIGKLLRRTSLDELPQLFNVLRLEMSLVGPRPIVTAEVARYGEDIAYYHETRPGLTGLWQVSGRTDTSYVRRVQLDTWYVKNWTMWHDLAILAKTVPAVLRQRGAF